jgi:hypothetical protein
MSHIRQTYKTSLCALAWGSLLAALPTAHAQLDQTPVADTFVACEVLDPEIHQNLNIMVWQQLNDDEGSDDIKDINEAVVQYVDPETGQFTGNAGVISADVASYDKSQAGPKFANGSDGVWLAFSRRPGAIVDEAPPPANRTVGMMKYNPPTCGIQNPAGCFHDQIQIPLSENEEFCVVRASVYTTEEEDLDDEPAAAAYQYREVNTSPCPDPPGQEEKGLRWDNLEEWDGQAGNETSYSEPTAPWGRIEKVTEGNDAGLWVVTTTDDVNDVAQVTLVRLDNPGTVVVVTGNDDNQDPDYDPGYAQKKFNPIIWHDPNTTDDLLVMRQSAATSPTESEIAVWRKSGNNDWLHHFTFTPEEIGDGDLPFALSPEPFVWDGRSYIVFSTADALNFDMQDDGNMWVVRLDWDPLYPSGGEASIDWSRQVNIRPGGQEARRRLEGEVYVLTEGDPVRPVIYYSMFENQFLDDEICDYDEDTQSFEVSTLHIAEVCPPGLTDPPCD